jgi:hypothetical protein
MATDLARGQPAEQALRACLVATALAELTGLRAEQASRLLRDAAALHRLHGDLA